MLQFRAAYIHAWPTNHVEFLNLRLNDGNHARHPSKTISDRASYQDYSHWAKPDSLVTCDHSLIPSLVPRPIQKIGNYFSNRPGDEAISFPDPSYGYTQPWKVAPSPFFLRVSLRIWEQDNSVTNVSWSEGFGVQTTCYQYNLSVAIGVSTSEPHGCGDSGWIVH